jgi:hypothetical protein
MLTAPARVDHLFQAHGEVGISTLVPGVGGRRRIPVEYRLSHGRVTHGARPTTIADALKFSVPIGCGQPYATSILESDVGFTQAVTPQSARNFMVGAGPGPGTGDRNTRRDQFRRLDRRVGKRQQLEAGTVPELKAVMVREDTAWAGDVLAIDGGYEQCSYAKRGKEE